MRRALAACGVAVLALALGGAAAFATGGLSTGTNTACATATATTPAHTVSVDGTAVDTIKGATAVVQHCTTVTYTIPTTTVTAPPKTVTSPPVTITQTVTGPATSTQTTTAAQTTTTSAAPPPSQTKNCAGTGTKTSNTVSQSALQACGFPSMSTTGPPAGTSFKAYPNGLMITSPGVYSDMNVTGGIDVEASNVTITDSQVTDADNSNAAVYIGKTADNVTISYTSIHGTSDSGSGAEYSAVQAVYANTLTDVVLDHDQFYNGDRILTGYGTVKDSYCLGGATFGTEHDECVYTSGAAPGIDLEHDTLINANPWQTAAVFIDSPGPGGYGGNDGSGSITINDSLLAGGGYCLYGGNGGSGHTGPESITNDRFATVFYSTCGQFGAEAYMPGDTRSSGDVWDSTGGGL